MPHPGIPAPPSRLSSSRSYPLLTHRHLYLFPSPPVRPAPILFQPPPPFCISVPVMGGEEDTVGMIDFKEMRLVYNDFDVILNPLLPHFLASCRPTRAVCPALTALQRAHGCRVLAGAYNLMLCLIPVS